MLLHGKDTKGPSMRSIISAAAILAFAACDTIPAGNAPADSAETALATYYASVLDSALPETSAAKPLPSEDTVMTRILVGSCNDEERASPALAQIAREKADMFLMIGDNVYGDKDGPRYENNDPDLTEVRESFSDLGKDPDFMAARAAHPMMVAWDDHDYGANDAGANFPFRILAERVHEKFWGLGDTEAANHEGTYYAKSFGPDGKRTQIIMLDTRYFRSDLQATDDWGAKGKERYMPSAAAGQQMLGEAQWAWLEDKLKEPADLRLLVSSIQIVPDVHGWESWDKLPAERERLYNLIKDTGAKGVVAVSGDRHTAFLYRKDGVINAPLYELTASSLNLSFRDESDEVDTAQIGSGYAKTNFGSINVDWEKGTAALDIHAEDGRTVRSVTAKFR